MRSPYVPTDPTKAEFLTDLDVRELRTSGARLKQLLQDLVFYSAEIAQASGGNGILIAPKGTISNYASAPEPFWGIVTPDGPWKWAAVIHDAASHGELVTETGHRVHCVKHVTDKLFREGMRVPPCDEVPGWKRWFMYRAVVLHGTGAYGGPVPQSAPRALFGQTPIGDAIDQLGKSGDGLSLDLGRDTSGKTSVGVEGTKSFGKDKTWSASGAVQWAKAEGYAVLGKLRWTPK